MNILKIYGLQVVDTTEGDDGSLSVQNMPSANKNSQNVEVFIIVDLKFVAVSPIRCSYFSLMCVTVNIFLYTC